jgi:predicted transposase YbfD/YdcC
LEKRTITTTSSLNRYLNWPGVNQVVRIRRERTLKGRRESETAYYVTSLSSRRANASRILELVRRHWGAIENGLHHVRDTTFDEDRCTIFRGEAPENLASLRNLALNWLRKAKIGKIAATIRSFARNSQRLFTQLGFVK